MHVSKNLDEPSNIQWENIQYSKLKRCCRKMVSTFASLLILVISIAVVSSEKFFIDQLNKSYYNINIDCNQVDYSQESVIEEFNNNAISLRDKTKTFCFCNSIIIKEYIGAKNYKLPDNSQPCYEVTDMILVMQSVSIAISIAIPVLNSLLIILLRGKYNKFNLITNYD